MLLPLGDLFPFGGCENRLQLGAMLAIGIEIDGDLPDIGARLNGGVPAQALARAKVDPISARKIDRFRRDIQGIITIYIV